MIRYLLRHPIWSYSVMIRSLLTERGEVLTIPSYLYEVNDEYVILSDVAKCRLHECLDNSGWSLYADEKRVNLPTGIDADEELMVPTLLDVDVTKSNSINCAFL